MRARLGFLAVPVLVVFAVSSAAGMAHLKADLAGAQEVPPNGSPATGVAQCLIDTATNTLFYHVSYGGLLGTETAAHIHGYAPAGMNGGVLQPLPATNPKIGTWVYPEANEADILAGLIYFNIHTTMFPGGEIRGQVGVDPLTDLVALMDGAQEVPPTGSPGLGIGVFRIDTVANNLQYDIRFGNLAGTESAAHIHGPAPVGVNAGVLTPLPLGSPKIGTWIYPEAQEGNILGGLTYVNVHSSVNPGGEIRGQILGLSPATGVEDVVVSLGGEKSLLAVPNPVRDGNVALFYRVPRAGRVAVTIHDVTGRVVRTVHDTQSREAGILSWDTRDDRGHPVAAGVYFAHLIAGETREMQRVVVVR